MQYWGIERPNGNKKGIKLILYAVYGAKMWITVIIQDPTETKEKHQFDTVSYAVLARKYLQR